MKRLSSLTWYKQNKYNISVSGLSQMAIVNVKCILPQLAFFNIHITGGRNYIFFLTKLRKARKQICGKPIGPEFQSIQTLIPKDIYPKQTDICSWYTGFGAKTWNIEKCACTTLGVGGRTYWPLLMFSPFSL
jgi:hypothetical protein